MLRIRPDWRNPVHLAAFGFGSGAPRRAPGTWGTVGGLLPWLALRELPLAPYLAVVAAAFVLGIWLCSRTSRDLGVHDHGGIVWDEFVGLWVALILLPPGIGWILAGFVLFRFFDILKPWPIRWADRRVSGGLGIMLDDLLAGLYSLGLLQLAAWWLGVANT